MGGKAYSTFLHRRRRDPRFAAAWDAALAAFEQARNAALAPPETGPNPVLLAGKAKRAAFLQALAETSSVSMAERRSGMNHREAYKLRRRDPRFAAAWRNALIEGYDLLELELLGYLRDRQPRHKMDVSGALRLLAAHRETVLRERALRVEDDEEAVLESIDRFLEDMRERRLANAALLADHSAGQSTESDDALG